MIEAALFTLALGIAIRELREMLNDFLCANKEMKLSVKFKTKR